MSSYQTKLDIGLSGETQVRSQALLNHIRMPKRNAEAVLEYSTAYPFRLRGQSHILCVYCLEEYEDPDEYRQHIDKSHRIPRVSTAFAHRKAQDAVKVDCTNLQCRVCSEPFDTIEDIARHIKDVHDCKKLNLKYKIGLHPFKLNTEKWECVICEKKLPSIFKLCRHTTTHFLQHTCDICGNSYLTNEALKYHIKCKHVKNPVCRKCWQEFDSLEEKKEHLRTTKSCRPFLCLTCGERFLSWELKEKHHVEIHGRPKRTYRCPECAIDFESRNHFYSHYKVHHTDEGYICTCCGLKFDAKYKLDDHRFVHSGEKNYQCTVCLKSFSRQKSLTQHLWIHSEKKRFPCVVCDKQFAQKVSLKAHMKSYHPDVEVIY